MSSTGTIAKRKLATTPYNPEHAHAEFKFIDLLFIPQGKSDQEDYEGGLPIVGRPVAKQTPIVALPTSLCIRIPARPLLSITQDAPPTASKADKSGKSPGMKLAHMSTGKIQIPLLATKLSKETPTKTTEAITQEDMELADDGSDADEDDKGTMWHTFCLDEYHEPIIKWWRNTIALIY